MDANCTLWLCTSDTWCDNKYSILFKTDFLISPFTITWKLYWFDNTHEHPERHNYSKQCFFENGSRLLNLAIAQRFPFMFSFRVFDFNAEMPLTCTYLCSSETDLNPFILKPLVQYMSFMDWTRCIHLLLMTDAITWTSFVKPAQGSRKSHSRFLELGSFHLLSFSDSVAPTSVGNIVKSFQNPPAAIFSKAATHVLGLPNQADRLSISLSHSAVTQRKAGIEDVPQLQSGVVCLFIQKDRQQITLASWGIRMRTTKRNVTFL